MHYLFTLHYDNTNARTLSDIQPIYLFSINNAVIEAYGS